MFKIGVFVHFFIGYFHLFYEYKVVDDYGVYLIILARF
jgi:hypothetical protein